MRPWWSSSIKTTEKTALHHRQKMSHFHLSLRITPSPSTLFSFKVDDRLTQFRRQCCEPLGFSFIWLKEIQVNRFNSINAPFLLHLTTLTYDITTLYSAATMQVQKRSYNDTKYKLLFLETIVSSRERYAGDISSNSEMNAIRRWQHDDTNSHSPFLVTLTISVEYGVIGRNHHLPALMLTWRDPLRNGHSINLPISFMSIQDSSE